MNNPVHMGWKFLRKGDGSSELSPFFAKKREKTCGLCRKFASYAKDIVNKGLFSKMNNRFM